LAPPIDILPAIFDSPVQGILCTRGDGTIVYCNRTLSRAFGYSPEELTGAPVELLLPESVRASHVRMRELYRAAPVVRPMGVGVELAGRRKDGTTFPVEVSLSHARVEGDLLIVAFVADISLRKELEGRLAQSQKMEALGLLSAGLAHDFNNLLTIILGYLEQSVDRWPAKHPLHESGEAALKASHQAAHLVGQLFSFARRPAVPEASLDINRVVSDQASLLRKVAGPGRQVTLQLDSAPCAALAESSEVERALVNLVANARDATGPGGWILIETRPVELDHTIDPASPVRQTKPYIQLAVSDNGRGLSRAEQSRIFEPFYTTKEQGRGAGLGLALLYTSLRRSGGDIRFQSEPGQGTTFKLFFPRQAVSPRPVPIPDAVPAGSETVLVVDDERDVREVCATMLRLLGCQVLTAARPEDAIEVSRSHPGVIHTLLTDVLMPGMQGPDLARVLSAERPDMRVVYMSGYTAGSMDRHQMLSSEAAYLSKPFTMAELEAAVLRHARGGGHGIGSAGTKPGQA
jgi:PAS domain S-box-containing protein